MNFCVSLNKSDARFKLFKIMMDNKFVPVDSVYIGPNDVGKDIIHNGSKLVCDHQGLYMIKEHNLTLITNGYIIPIVDNKITVYFRSGRWVIMTKDCILPIGASIYQMLSKFINKYTIYHDYFILDDGYINFPNSYGCTLEEILILR